MIYTTKSYIENETYTGPDCAGCMTLNKSAYQKSTFPKQIFY